MEKETSCINTKAIFDYVRAHNNGDCSGLLGGLDREIDALPRVEEFFKDPNNWISCAVAAELYKRAKTILNDEQAPYKIAKFAIENASLGYIQKIFVKAFWSTKTALRHIQRINDKFNRSKRVELVDVAGNAAVVRLHWDPTMAVSKDICLYNQGTYTFMPLPWGSAPPQDPAPAIPLRIVNVSSGAATRASPGRSAYCQSTAALDMAGAVLAEELGEVPALMGRDVAVVSYSPGVVDTAMQEQLRAADESSFPRKQRFVDLFTSGELVRPEEPALEIVEFLVADAPPPFSRRRLGDSK